MHSPRRLRLRWLHGAAAALLLAAAGSSMAVDAGPGEGRLKVAYLYNFTKLVEFPHQPSGTFNFCILGSVPFSDHLGDLEGQTAGGAQIMIRMLPTHGDPVGCHALFIPESERSELPSLLAKAESMSILTIGDSEGYSRAGVMLNLKLLQGKLRFDVNLKAARRGGLKISANLLRLAQTIEE